MTKRTKPGKTKVRNYLRAHGHKSTKVDALSLANDEQVRVDLCAVHNISRAEYARAGV